VATLALLLGALSLGGLILDASWLIYGGFFCKLGLCA
jgi:hypothetical protein